MMKKHTLGFLILPALIASTATPTIAETQQPTSVLVCRARQCADASFSMTKGFLFNKIAQMFRNNNGKSVLVCEADPVSHVCLQEGISVPAQTPFSDMTITLDGLNLVEEKLISGQPKLDVVFDYKIQANNMFPRCQLGVSQLSVNYLDQVELISQDIICNITETGRTSLNATYNIDYLDFDYGFIGAYYTIGIGEAIRGEKNGYILMRFTHKAPFEDVPLTETNASDTNAESTEQPLPIKTLPDILRHTTPTPTPGTLSLKLGPKKGDSKTEQKRLPVQKKKVVQKNVSVAETPTPQTVQNLNPTVIKTTVVEKTVITPDGKRSSEPPETRTILNNGRETMVIR